MPKAPGPFLWFPASSQHGRGAQQPGKVSLVPSSLAATTEHPQLPAQHKHLWWHTGCLKQGRFLGGKGRYRVEKSAGPMDVCSRHRPSIPRDEIQHLCPELTPAAAAGAMGQQGTWGEGSSSRTACLFFSADQGFAGAGGIHLAERGLFFMEEMRQRTFNRK